MEQTKKAGAKSKKVSIKNNSVSGIKAENSKRLTVLKTYKLFIDGKFPRTESGHYYKITDRNGELIANVCRASKKDFRNAVVAARKAQPSWAARSAYNKGQILYRIAETLEGRQAQFCDSLTASGLISKNTAIKETQTAIDRLIYYAGWCDKYQQIFSSVNPVESSHFNFSFPEPTGVVSALAPEHNGLTGLVSVIAPVIAGGNSIVALASEKFPLTAIEFAEVLHTSDVPAGVVNILTGIRDENYSPFSQHLDVNAVIYCGNDASALATIKMNAAENVKRVVHYNAADWLHEENNSPYKILDFQEIKTTWHPVGS